MASTFQWNKDNGTATGAPAAGTTRGVAVNSDWKAVDDNTTVFSDSSVQQGTNSYEVWLSGQWTGAFTNISNVLWAHTSGVVPSGITMKGKNGLTYTTPSRTANANLTTDMTAAISIASGQAVNVGGTSPQAAGKAASSSANPTYTEFLTTQMQVANTSVPADSGLIVQSIQWNEI